MKNQNKLLIIVSTVLIIGMILTAIISYTMYVSNQARQRESLRADIQDLRKRFTRFDYSARLYQQAIQNRVQQKREALSGLRELFSTQKTVGWKDFAEFVSPICKQHPDIQGVFWIPRIDRKALSKFAQVSPEKSPPEFELQIDNEDIRSGSPDVWPIYFAAPVKSNREWLGMNAETHPAFVGVFEGYVDQDKPWLSHAFRPERKSHRTNFFFAMNVKSEERKLAKGSEHTVLYNSGFVAVLINVPTLLQEAIDDLDTNDADRLKVYLYDKKDRRIATAGPVTEDEQKVSQSVAQLETSLRGDAYIDREINVVEDDGRWHAFFEPEEPFGVSIPNEYTGGNMSWVVAIIAGVLLTLVMAALAYRITKEMLRRKTAEKEQRQLALRDSLTGLLNRRVLSELLEREWAQFSRTGKPFSVLVLDLDHFKSINDTYGHSAGDDILRRTGSILCNAARHSDAACRYGGEEFCLILPEADSLAAYTVAERSRDELASQTFDTPRNTPDATVHITCSVGIATANGSDGSGEDVLQRADAALYSAKKQGRNCVAGTDKCI